MTHSKRFRFIMFVVICLIAAFSLSACGKVTNQGNRLEDSIQNLNDYNLVKNQPPPVIDYSQARQNLKEIELAEAKGVTTMSYFFNQGVKNPIFECPSIGASIPAAATLTHQIQTQKDNIAPVNNGGGNTEIDQMDADGYYHEDTTGTYTMCAESNGNTYPFYWEGYVGTGFIESHWDSSQGMIVNDGQPTYDFTKSAADAGVKVQHATPPSTSGNTGSN